MLDYGGVQAKAERTNFAFALPLAARRGVGGRQ
jgi:hypothetical protein